jgi:pimeloyl-ACP methyl ester carboxylesterase
VSNPVRALVRALTATAAGIAAACGGGGSNAPTAQPAPTVASATIGPAGGTVAFTVGPHAGVGIQVPAGALTAPTLVTLRAEVVVDPILSIFPVYRVEPRGVPLQQPATITLRAASQLVQGDGQFVASGLVQPRDVDAWQPMATTIVDADKRGVAATTPWFGDFAVLNASLHRLFTQPRALLDPATPTPIATIAGGQAVFAAGDLTVRVGRGSLASFWSSPAAANVLVVPGLFGSPVDYLGAQNLVAALPASVQNVVVLSYASGPGVAATANELYNLIAAQRQPGFGCAIVGHSMGGLVGRYLIERSHTDALRPGWQPGAASFAGTVARLILLGVPQNGSDIGEALVATFLAQSRPEEQGKLQAAIDLSYRTDAITRVMNAQYVDNATRYHVAHGGLGFGTDGVVTIASALALPLGPDESAVGFPVLHDALHTEAAANGVAAHVAALLQAP